MSLPLHQQFEKQQIATAIASATDLDELKGVAAQLLDLYFRHRAAAADIASQKISDHPLAFVRDNPFWDDSCRYISLPSVFLNRRKLVRSDDLQSVLLPT